MNQDRESILGTMTDFQNCCVLGGAADLELWDAFDGAEKSAKQVSEKLKTDLRVTEVLLNALAALNLLEKKEDLFSVPSKVEALMSVKSPENILPMIWHRMNMMRGWVQLAHVAEKGTPAERRPSVRGGEADRAAFVAAMHTVSGPVADEVVGGLGKLEFKHALDVGGASGTWAMALLRANPNAKATIFDLPDAIEQAKERIAKTEFSQRVSFVGGDFYHDDLPTGVDFAWVSAIIHQHSRLHNRELYAKVYKALEPGGTIAIRDMVMKPCLTQPAWGALFAINMVVHTETGRTFSFEEIKEDLESSGFDGVELALERDDMSSVVTATKVPIDFSAE